jgi:hypothetical protein
MNKDGCMTTKTEIVRIITRGKCGRCGLKDCEETHHIDGDNSNDDYQNLIPVCRECHLKLQNDLVLSFVNKLNISEEEVITFNLNKLYCWENSLKELIRLKSSIIGQIEGISRAKELRAVSAKSFLNIQPKYVPENETIMDTSSTLNDKLNLALEVASGWLNND